MSMGLNKKKLPKAITRPTDDLRQASAARGEEAPREAAVLAADANQQADDGTVAPFRGLGGDLVEVAPAPRPVALRRFAPGEPNAVWRLSRANAIVERHATYSAAGGIIPIPVVNVASVMAIILRMVRMLSNLYGVPFERDRARALVVALAGGATPTGLAAMTSSTLYYVVPASAVIGLAVSSVAAVACTRSIGRVFVEHFESGATLRDFSATARS